MLLLAAATVIAASAMAAAQGLLTSAHQTTAFAFPLLDPYERKLEPSAILVIQLVSDAFSAEVLLLRVSRGSCQRNNHHVLHHFSLFVILVQLSI